MKASVIISTYKRTDNLSLIFQALDRQTYTDFEVIVSEDDYNPEMIFYLSVERKRHAYTIHHLNQEKDNGFRKNQMLNRSVEVATGELLIFLDGDCIPHKQLVAAYVKNAAPYRILTGRRVMLSKGISQSLYQDNTLRSLSMFRILKSGCRHAEEGFYFPFIPETKVKGILGCNWAIRKEHIIAVNGYDEDYSGAAYGEDLDIEWRLLQTGCHLFSMKFRAIAYHLDHALNYNAADTAHSKILWEQKHTAKVAVCINGLKKPARQEAAQHKPRTLFPPIAQAL
jgi:GT2 family glycosyltransferase